MINRYADCAVIFSSYDHALRISCLLVTFVIPTKMAEPIEMRIWGLTLVGPRNRY